MDFLKIKNLVKQNGDKFILVENGEPEVVMMSFGEYEKLVKRDPNHRMYPNDPNSYDEIYSDNSGDEFRSFGSRAGLRETEFIAPVVAETVGLPVRLEDIRLEDLPI